MFSMSSIIYMIPCPIAENATHTIPSYVRDTVYGLTHFIVERSKTARKFLKEIKHPVPQNQLHVEEMDKHDKSYAQKVIKEWIHEGKQIGVISEAGCPGIADPGAELVAIAHQKNVRVIPLVGPSSLLLSLMASGMNGQRFTFHGYLPAKNPATKQALKKIEREINSHNSAELFIETPYRNHNVFKEILSVLPGHFKLCIAADITGQQEFIKTQSVSEWKKRSFPFKEKIPTIFILSN